MGCGAWDPNALREVTETQRALLTAEGKVQECTEEKAIQRDQDVMQEELSARVETPGVK
jgi:hypothetical protein